MPSWDTPTQRVYDSIWDEPGVNCSAIHRQTHLDLAYVLKVVDALERQRAIWVDRAYVDPGAFRCYPTV